MTLLRAAAGALVACLLGLLLIPIGVLVGALLLLSDLLARGVLRRPAPGAAPPAARDTSAASLMILNWNGRAFLEPLLASVDAAVTAHGGAHEVIVIDNGSTDDSVQFVRSRFPHVKLVQHARNEKFVRGYNLAFAAATKDVIVLLNNDMVVARDFLQPLLDGLAAHPRAFAVSAQITMADPRKQGIETGRTAGSWSCGMIKLAHLPVPEDAGGLWPCLWAGGGSSAVDRRMLADLGGFEALFDPFYFEDASLSYQAWKRGHVVLLAPQAKVVHAHRGSSGRLRPMTLERVQRRNAHLFVWRSFDDVRMTLAASLLLSLTGVRMALREGFARAPRRALVEGLAVASALLRLPQAIGARMATRRLATRSDRQVLALAHSRHRTARAVGARVPADAPLRLLLLFARVPRRDADGSFVQFELVRRLAQRHHVTAFALADTPAMAARASDLAPHVARLETMVLTREPARVDLLRQDPPRLRRDYSDAGIRARLRELLATQAFDVVQVDYFEMAYAVADLVDGLAAVHVVHDPAARAAYDGGRIAAAHDRARAVQTERRLLRPFARIVCMSDADARALQQSHPFLRGPQRAPIVIKNGIDVTRYAAGPPSDAPTLLFVGSYAHEPNVRAAIFAAREVLPRVRARVPQARLLLVGHDPQGKLAALAALDGVELLGFVNDLAAATRAAGCYLAPLRDGGGMRSKVLEAMAFAKPIVGTGLSFTGIDGTSGVHYLAADDADGLAAACARVLGDADLRRKLGDAARALVEQQHSAEAMTTKYESLYRELISTAPPP